MLTATRQTKAGEIERNIHVSILNHVVTARISEFRQRKTKPTNVADSSTTYTLRRMDTQLPGIGVEVEKRDGTGEVYHLLLHGRNGHTCSCPHGTYRPNSKPCRHVAAALEALSQGIL